MTRTDLIERCVHPSSIGAEGPVADLGRMPILWLCCACGALHLSGGSEPGGAA